MEQKKGKVYLVGAGCGSADLITLRGKNLLEQCDVVVYDDLIDLSLLAMASKAEHIYMGKRSGKCSSRQDDINNELIRLASLGHTVVRLKGGDPFVFGRGGEEMLALLGAGICCEVVPGISSSIAIPSEAGIPVTHRATARSFHVITGHTREGGLPENFDALAKLNGTLIFLMGWAHLEEICTGLIAAGKDGNTPAALLSGGNSKHRFTLRATLATLPQLAKEAEPQPPLIILVGDVAAMDLRSPKARPLAGVSIELTGSASMVEKLKDLFAPLGAICTTTLSMVMKPIHLVGVEEELCKEKTIVVLTSGNGVKRFFEEIYEMKLDLRRLSGCRFAVIGKASADALAKYGILADICPTKEQGYTSMGLFEALMEHADPEEKILLLRSAQADNELLLALQKEGRSVVEHKLYDMEPVNAQEEETQSDYVVFASAGSVKAYFAKHGKLNETTKPVCIGPVCAQELKKHIDTPFLLAGDISAEGIVECICADRRA